MATILDFPAREPRRGVGRVRRREAASAEIVLFPGIRYERWETATTPAKAAATARRKSVKRDTLDLLD